MENACAAHAGMTVVNILNFTAIFLPCRTVSVLPLIVSFEYLLMLGGASW